MAEIHEQYMIVVRLSDYKVCRKKAFRYNQSMSLGEARKLGMPKTTYYRLRKTLGNGKTVKLRRKTVDRL
ncbi:MAG: hypothetical protein QXD02_03465 [Candidatus Parvarchaeum sp.]|nr:hypothetical protein [Candidatus Parvarchaeum tengchongense]